MRALYLPSTYSSPRGYRISDLPKPKITTETPLLIQVYACSLNTGDTHIAKGDFRFMHSTPFPHIIGHEFAGIITERHPSYAGEFQIGDEVFGVIPVTMNRGAAAQFLVASDHCMARKPARLSFAEAAALGVAGVTAITALDLGEELLGGLVGRTVFVSATLGGVGSVAVQLAKHAYGAARVIGTVSTGKLGMVGEKLGDNTVDSVVDYVREDVVDRVGRRKVDLFFDTQGTVGRNVGVVRKGGVVVSCSSLCSGTEMEKLMPAPLLVRVALDIISWTAAKWYGLGGVTFKAVLAVENRSLLERLAKLASEGKVRGVVGTSIKMDEENLDAIQEACGIIVSGKGGVGRLVLEID
ncbi:GroES-like protein [Ascodesmis nigricans]|uniref:GroES-like protein n=1 Tax=Ascodesmis nigricans TaxID=341454 RepID=A0A4V3SHI7_9PEZI|nr:GroES-like protein [Ascodesmis nigricans]